MDDNDITQAVRDTALLADLSLAMWSAERNDKGIIDKAKEDAGAVGNVGRAIKNLMAGADVELKAVKAAFAAVRAAHYSLTLPWVADPHAERQRGPRLLPTALWDRYITTIQGKKAAAMQARDAFVAVYPQRAVEAQANLAGLADPKDYPTAEEVRAQFRIAFDFNPLPAGAQFRGLPEGTLRQLDTALKHRQQHMLETATKAMWDEVRDRMNHLSERLSAGKLRAPTVEHARELAALLPGWNVAGDPRAAQVAQIIDHMLPAEVTAAVLRDDEERLRGVTEQTQAVLDKLAKWGL